MSSTSGVELIPLDQLILDQDVVVRDIPGKGRGLVATRDLMENEQMLFINKPLMLNLEDAWLRDTCYQCLRTFAKNAENASGKYQRLKMFSLKNCQQCKVVKYCSKACQKLSWHAHHKYECRSVILF